MRQRTSPVTMKRYGLARVCKAWDFLRSTFYSRRAQKQIMKSQAGITRQRPGPKAVISDEELLGIIRRDLENSPFTREGHRKVYARIKREIIIKGLSVSRRRVLRLMREHKLLSFHLVVQGDVKLHNGRITTDAPNRMWGADAVKVQTVEDGWAWVFWSIEHWNAECVGWHVAKKGDRFAAMEPIAMGLKVIFGSLEKEVVRGLSIRIDHGSQYTSEDFKNQIRYWGIGISMAFVREPETNGVVESV